MSQHEASDKDGVLPGDDIVVSFRLTLDGENHTVPIAPGETLLQVALAAVQTAVAALGTIGTNMNAKDDAYLQTLELTKPDLAGYKLKSTEQPPWNRLKRLLDDMTEGPVAAENRMGNRAIIVLLLEQGSESAREGTSRPRPRKVDRTVLS